jgi:putative transposase
VVTELRNRGVQDIFIACVDGLKGFPEAIEAVFRTFSAIDFILVGVIA